MILTLPDNSVVSFNRKTLRFRSVGGSSKPTRSPSKRSLSEGFERLIRNLQKPTLPYYECFRRICDLPRYSPIRTKHTFQVDAITWLYRFWGKYDGGTFCPSETAYRFLDGGIFEHNGYGWGSHSWTVVQGSEALRVVCMVCGIQQPQRLKGEPARRPLSILLQEVSQYPVELFPVGCPAPS